MALFKICHLQTEFLKIPISFNTSLRLKTARRSKWANKRASRTHSPSLNINPKQRRI